MRSYYQRLSAILFLSFLFTSFSACIDVPFSNPDGLIVILKADDLGEMTPNWSRFMKIVEDDTICAGIGVISKNVKTEAARQNIRLTSTLKQPNNFPVIEFWNHGFDHSSFKGSTEFGGTGNVEQLNHMHLAQKFFTDTLKLTSHCFGAPFNRTTNVTHAVIDSFPEINVWQCYQRHEHQNNPMWKDPNKSIINLEDQHILLDIDYVFYHIFPVNDIIKNFDRDNVKPYVVIQIHPAVWHNKNFADFEKLIHFYKYNHRATFMTPTQYYNHLHKINMAVL